jgi:ketosteroid isomerase-like protein
MAPRADVAHVARDDTAWAAYWAVATPLFAPDFVFVADVALESPDMAGQTYRGSEGFRRSIETYTEPFESVIFDFERIVGSGDRFVSIHRVRARARHTGISFEEQAAYLWTFRDGRIVHIRNFRDVAEALKAAGLEE